MPSRACRNPRILIALPVLLFGSGVAHAAAPAAWDAFRKEVEASCLKAAGPLLTEAKIVVDPFGSESYGLAFVSGLAVEDKAPRSLVCVYDKAEKQAEIGGTMALETAVPELRPDVETTASIESPAAGPLASEGNPGGPAAALSERFLSPSAAALAAVVPASPDGAPPELPADVAALVAPAGPNSRTTGGFAGQCDATCAVTLSNLADADRRALEGLSAEVTRTLDAGAATDLAEGPEKARDSARAVAASTEGATSAGISVPTERLLGETSCVLYYYGYSNEAARTVGRHRCSVGKAEDGALVVEKVSGERLRAELRPLTKEVSAFVGRSFEGGASTTRYDRAKPVDAANSELGNTVGFAAEDDGRLVLVSSQRRRFEADGDFFWVLALDAK